MVKQIKVVVGANFGDEGKGLMTDYFCHELSQTGSVLNIRHNGGAQAGHTVVLPDGKRHVFSHFGSGSFVPHVATYLSQDFILNPMLFCRELDRLKNKFGLMPRVFINPYCRLTTPYDMLINQIAERSRGDARHGSCGLGINETVVRNERIRTDIGLFASNPALLNHLVATLIYLRKEYVPRRLKQLGVENISIEDMNLIESDIVLENWMTQLTEMLNYCTIAGDEILDNYDGLVFEGAQGLLLDNDCRAFAPHLTTSKTGSFNPKNILARMSMQDRNIEFCYVTRSYFTRHGAGKFPSECDKSAILPEGVVDKTNHFNEFQREFRYGYFDEYLFENATEKDLLYRHCDFSKARYTRAVTHLDETDGKLIGHDGKELPFPSGTRYRSYGETRNDVHCLR